MPHSGTSPLGIYGKSGASKRIADSLHKVIEGLDPEAEAIRFPPVMARSVLETAGYVRSFPHLLGTVSCFCGHEDDYSRLMNVAASDAERGQLFELSDLALTPSACYPVYPLVAAGGDLPATGRLFNISSWCFRREPSAEPGRLQAFEMREYVRVGTVQQCQDFQTEWIERGGDFLNSLGLDFDFEPAHDPFFGTVVAGVMVKNQKDHKLKSEFRVLLGGGKPAACMSVNYHLDHFSRAFDIRINDRLAHTTCFGFGIDRLTLALLARHGEELQQWPKAVLSRLDLSH